MELTKEEKKELKNHVERIPQFEEKLGLSIENISFNSSEDSFEIYGDLIMDNMDKYYYIDIFGTLYDEDNDILNTERATIFREDFLGFETFKIFFHPIEPKDIKKIRIYPKAKPR